MRIHLTPPQLDFYELFTSLAETVRLGAEQYFNLLKDFTDVHAKVDEIIETEHKGDQLTRQIMRANATTFVAPFDSGDISELASGLDTVLDHIEAAADYLSLHQIEEPLPRMVGLAEKLAQAAFLIAVAMPKLRNPQELALYYVELNRLENEGDALYRRTLAELFSGDYSTMEVLQYQDIVNETEAAIDALEDVANIVEGISLRQT